MTKFQLVRLSRVLLVAISAIPLGGLPGQQPPGHEEHHPAAPASGRGAIVPPKSSGMRGMMMPPAPLDAYPTVMNLSDLAPVARAQLELESNQRMLDGVSAMSKAMDRVLKASRREDYGTVYGALGDLRSGLARLEAGLAGKSALADESAPQKIALSWFRSEMSLPAPTPKAVPITALSPFHLGMMAILALFAALMVILHIVKMRRVGALAAQWRSAPAVEARQPKTTP